MLKNFAALSIKMPLYFNYSVGYVGIGLMTNVVVTWAMYFYSPPLSSGRTIYMSAAAFGLIIALGRIVDAFTDPLISVWSDGFRSPYGRRIPFIAAGALPTVLAFIFIWYPPVPGPAALNTVYLMAMLGLMFLGLTVITCPFLALMPEIATTPGERMRAAEGIALAHIAAVATAMLGAAFFIEEFGFQAMAIFAGTVALVSFLSPVLTVREAPRDSSREPFSFRESLLLTLKNRVFLPYILSLPFFWFGFNFVLMGIPYITTVQIGLSESMVGIALVLALLVALELPPGAPPFPCQGQKIYLQRHHALLLPSPHGHGQRGLLAGVHPRGRSRHGFYRRCRHPPGGPLYPPQCPAGRHYRRG